MTRPRLVLPFLVLALAISTIASGQPGESDAGTSRYAVTLQATDSNAIETGIELARIYGLEREYQVGNRLVVTTSPLTARSLVSDPRVASVIPVRDEMEAASDPIRGIDRGRSPAPGSRPLDPGPRLPQPEIRDPRSDPRTLTPDNGNSPHPVYIAVLNDRGRDAGGPPDFVSFGAREIHRWRNRVVLQIPEASVEPLRAHRGINYLQKVRAGNGPPGQSSSLEMSAAATTAPDPELAANPVDWTSGPYVYDGTGNIVQIGTPAAPGTDGENHFVYDGLSRLVDATVASRDGAHSAKYVYDGFGNLTSRRIDTIANSVPSIDSSTNRFDELPNEIEYLYDGSLRRGSGRLFYYDPYSMVMIIDYGVANRQEMLYTASGERIASCDEGYNYCIWSFRGFDGKVLTQFETEGAQWVNQNTYWLWLEDFVYREGGQLLGSAREPEEGGRLHYHLDHLGTPRLVTNAVGDALVRSDYFPYGHEITSIRQMSVRGFEPEHRFKFTGHERDFLGGTQDQNAQQLDYMHARFYDPNLGRFLTVDPAMTIKKNLGRPQRWNRYAYVQNNPLAVI
ncbi:MAG: RHS repeat-associated core domain-containing protein, partial [Halobacteriales archaeon]|nr:RHS repeat-associated core domain-containing protein [Halobacteriales archaeon]